MAPQLEGLESLRRSLGTQICTTWGCPKLGGIRTVVLWALYRGTPHFGNLPHWFLAEGGWVQLSPGNDPKPSTLNPEPKP